MAKGELYSKVIAWLKILLPLAALGLLSTVFLLSSDRETGVDLPFVTGELRDNAARQQVTAPYYAGTTADGASVTLRASAARPVPDAPDTAEADEISAQIVMQSGEAIDLSADRALVRNASQTVTLSGSVVIVTSQGYRLTTDVLEAALDRVAAQTPGAVRGTGPLGTLDAGRMELTTDAQTGDAHLLFTNGVKLVYTPQS